MLSPSLEAKIGQAVFIRTVTNYFTGRVVGITEANEVVLEEAAWIAVTGRFGTMLTVGVECITEVEPFPVDLLVYINRSSIIDWFDWKHTLPNKQVPT